MNENNRNENEKKKKPPILHRMLHFGSKTSVSIENTEGNVFGSKIYDNEEYSPNNSTENQDLSISGEVGIPQLPETPLESSNPNSQTSSIKRRPFRSIVGRTMSALSWYKESKGRIKNANPILHMAVIQAEEASSTKEEEEIGFEEHRQANWAYWNTISEQISDDSLGSVDSSVSNNNSASSEDQSKKQIGIDEEIQTLFDLPATDKISLGFNQEIWLFVSKEEEAQYQPIGYLLGCAQKLYYPSCAIPFQSVISVTITDEKTFQFKIKTLKKNYKFKADTEKQLNEWIKAIETGRFNYRFSGEDDIKILLPLPLVTEIKLVGDNIISETICITAGDEHFYFSYFNSIEDAYKKILAAWENGKSVEPLHVNRNSIMNILNVQSVDNRFFSRPSSVELCDSQLDSNNEGGAATSNSLFSLPDIEYPSPSDKPDGIQKKDSSHGSKTRWFNPFTTSEEIEKEEKISEYTSHRFCKIFGFPKEEKLLVATTCYFDRILPLIGKLYISKNYLCFRTRVVGVQSRVAIPIAEICRVEKAKSSLYYSISVTAFTQEEFIFDLTSEISQENVLRQLRKIREHSEDHGLDNAPLRESVTIKMKQKYGSHREIEQNEAKKPNSMHITLLTIGSRGDVQPYIAFGLGLLAEGHRVRIATHMEYKEWIEGFNIEFREVKGDPAEIMQLCIDNGMFTLSFFKEYLARFKPWMKELLISCFGACEGTDLLVESPSAIGGIHVAEALRIPYFSAFPFIWSRTKYYPHPFGTVDLHTGSTYNWMSHVMMEQIMWQGLRTIINRWRKKTLKLVPIGRKIEDWKVPFLYSFSPSIVPPPPDWPDWIHVCGYWFLDNPDKGWVPPESLLKFLSNGPPPVYIGFGSIIVQDPNEMSRNIIKAVEKAGVRAIISKGWSARKMTSKEEEIEFPPTIYSIPSVPHDWLFPKVAAVVHHGGAGTTAAGLRAGVPTIIKPFFGDQYFWGSRVQEMEVGLCIRKISVDILADALHTVTTNNKMKELARITGERIRSENGVEVAIRMLYRDLEYARKRINEIGDGHLLA